MKYWLLAIFVGLLSACGGGGGSPMSIETPTDNISTPPVDDSAAIQELAEDLATARREIEENIPQDEQAAYKTRIAALEKSLQEAEKSVMDLRALLTQIQQEIENIKSNPEPTPDDTTTDDTPDETPTDDTPDDTTTDDTPDETPTDDTTDDTTTDDTTDDTTTDDTTDDTTTDDTTDDTTLTFNTAEYRANPMYESIKPLYAYEKGYSGKGVTVAILEVRPDFNIGHPDLAENYITDSINGIHNSRLTAKNGNQMENDHSSRVAGLIAATRNDIGMHGIAPDAKMIPFDAAIGYYNRNGKYIKNLEAVAKYIRDNNIPIVNNSYGAEVYSPPAAELVLPYVIRQAGEASDYVGDSDTIWVWANGNQGFIGDDIRTSNELLYPILQPHLEKNWLGVISVDKNNQIPSYSNACGPAKDWCVATGVYDTYTPIMHTINEYGYRSGGNGNSYAAPQVSGALAILHEAIGIDSPQMARAILLTTTTDLGESGIDEIYGRGLINISAAIVMVENMKSAATEELSAVSFANLRGELPSGFAHLHNELSAIKLAIKLTTDLYYNVALSEMLTPGDAPNMPLGDAAAEMLENRGEETRRGIFAYGDINQEIGIRSYGGGNGYSYIAEGNQSATNNFSGNFGGIGGINGKTYGGKFGFTKELKANMQLFSDYERAKIIGKGEAGNLIKGARNARAESWTAGISFTDIWKYGDRIKLSANQEMKLSGGELIVRYPHAVGDFHKTFTGEESQKIEIRETFLPLKQKAKMHYTAGYAQKINAKSEWATAIEYNAGNNAKALSLIWQGEF